MGSSVPLPADADLYQPLTGGDPESLARAYRRYGALAYTVALRILGDPGRAEEVVQDAFTTLWRRPESYDPSRGSFRAWFLSIVHNRAIDVIRGRSGRERAERPLPDHDAPAAGVADPWAEVSLLMERKEVRGAVDSLPAEQRQAIELAYYEGRTHSEIAEVLGLPLGTVKGRLRLGLEKLRSYLAGRGFLEP